MRSELRRLMMHDLRANARRWALCALALVVVAPFALLPFTINPQRFVLPPSVEVALTLGTPASSAEETAS